MSHKYLIAIFIGVLSISSCSSDDDLKENTSSFLLGGSEERPINWIAPDYSLFELTMSVQVQLTDTLSHFQSSQDLMCATIDGEVRAVTGPKTTIVNDIYYPLIIAGNGNEKSITLHYYCDRLHRIFTLKDWTIFNASVEITGESGLYRPRFPNIIQ